MLQADPNDLLDILSILNILNLLNIFVFLDLSFPLGMRRGKPLMTFGVCPTCLPHSLEFFNCPAPLGCSFREPSLECPHRSRNSLPVWSFSVSLTIMHLFLFHWKRVMGITQQVKRSSQPSQG